MPKASKPHIVIVGAGLGGLSAALRLTARGYSVEIVERHARPGGKLNVVEKDGFRFDAGPTFFSMSYELRDLFADAGMETPVRLEPLDPLYRVHIRGRERPITMWRDPEKLATEFPEEPDFARKLERYLDKAASVFEDTIDRIVKRNFDSLAEYFFAMASVPPKHLPLLVRSMWGQARRHFETETAASIMTLISFFLGSTPFTTPGVYTLLNHVEFRHDGYWRVEGGMYRLVEAIVEELRRRGVRITLGREVVALERENGRAVATIDDAGERRRADAVLVNADAASFRGEILGRKKYAPEKLDKMTWTMGAFSIYLGVEGKIDELTAHNYFLGDDFRDYAQTIFTRSDAPEKPYYYVNVPSRIAEDYAPPGKTALMILAPVAHLQYKPDWSDRERFADRIVEDLDRRMNLDLKNRILSRTIFDPEDWRRAFRLHRGSSLGLAHEMRRVGAFRPPNRDEEVSNLFYVGGSTAPGAGLPMVVISSRLAVERVEEWYASVS